MSDFFPVDCSDTLRRIGLLVKSRRLEQGIRQIDVIQRLGVSEKKLRRIEVGDPAVSLREFMLVLWNLGLTEQIFKSLKDGSVSFVEIKEKTTGRRVRRKSSPIEDF